VLSMVIARLYIPFLASRSLAFGLFHDLLVHCPPHLLPDSMTPRRQIFPAAEAKLRPARRLGAL
jgi:hypothetical protein